MGFPEVFAKTSAGLFYPIKDIALFTNPQEYVADEGVIAIKAVAVDDSIDSDDPVAFIFDEKLFDSISANEWIAKNAQVTYSQKYYDVHIENGIFTVDPVVEEKDIQKFDLILDLITENSEKTNEELENSTEEKLVELEEESENSEYLNCTEKNNQLKINEIVDAIKEEFVPIFKEILVEFSDSLAKKSIANQEQILDNVDNNSSLKDESINNETLEIDETFDLDDSFLSTPGEKNENSSEDDLIEIDESIINDSKSETKDEIKTIFSELLKKALKDSFSNFNGKID
jgi:hypothetical protein